MRYLITGAGGFIGHELTNALLAKGEIVYPVYRSNRQATAPNEIPVFADLACAGWTEALPDAVDVIIHLAQSKRYREFPAGAADMVRVNIDATAELLDWAQQTGAQKFLLASTGNVYAPSSELLDESAFCRPTSMYAATKLSAEFLVQQYAKYFATVTLRFFGVYGPSQRDMIVPTMIDRVRSGKEVTLAQGAGLYFTPIYISDCLALLETLLADQSRQSAYEVYNIAGNTIVTLGEMVQQIADFYQVELKTIQIEGQPGYLQGNNLKIRQATHYTPQVAFAGGIKQVMSCVK